MDYKEKYEKALEKATAAYKDEDRHLKATLERIFPELKESEDERIKGLIGEALCDSKLRSEEVQDVLAWLEKQQGEQRPAEDEDREYACQSSEHYTRRELMIYNLGIADGKRMIEDAIKETEQKPADKVEPKFKVGDWVVYTGYLLKDSGKEIYVMQVASVGDDRYNFTDTSTLCFDSEKDMRSWTIQDAKDGDVLHLQKNGKEHIIIYKGVIKERFRTFVSAYCAYNGIVDAFCFADVNRYVDITYKGIMPATKEQRDLLFKKMTDAGYTFDFEKKELKKIEQKPAWSEEDEMMLGSVLDKIGDLGTGEMCKEWLKSLKERNTWKPSDEQMKALEHAINCYSGVSPTNTEEVYTLEIMKEQLKKLRG